MLTQVIYYTGFLQMAKLHVLRKIRCTNQVLCLSSGGHPSWCLLVSSKLLSGRHKYTADQTCLSVRAERETYPPGSPQGRVCWCRQTVWCVGLTFVKAMFVLSRQNLQVKNCSILKLSSLGGHQSISSGVGEGLQYFWKQYFEIINHLKVTLLIKIKY